MGESKVQKVARQTPGKLLMSFLQSIQPQVAMTGDTQGELGAARAVEEMPDAVMKYVNTILMAKNLPAGVVAEMRTIGETIDALMAGNVGRLGDVLAQRFRAVELQSTGEATWTQARHLEVITPRGASSVPPEMKEELRKADRKEQAWLGKGRPNPEGGGAWRPKSQRTDSGYK